MARLRCDDKDHSVHLRAEHTVGRSALCALQLPDERVSAQHALLRWSGESWQIKDLGSRNGTFVDDARVSNGATVSLQQGARLAFGRPDLYWILTDASAPQVLAIPVDGGEAATLQDDLIVLPDSDGAVIFSRDGTWFLESELEVRAIVDGDEFHAGSCCWRFVAPSVAAIPTVPEPLLALDLSSLSFRVSPDEEHVELAVVSRGRITSLGMRAHHYMALTLARQRIGDHKAGLPEHGWVEVRQLLRMLPDYQSPEHLNVDICRLRKQLSRAGFWDASRIIERRRGQVRIGVGSIEIATNDEGAPDN